MRTYPLPKVQSLIYPIVNTVNEHLNSVPKNRTSFIIKFTFSQANMEDMENHTEKKSHITEFEETGENIVKKSMINDSKLKSYTLSS